MFSLTPGRTRSRAILKVIKHPMVVLLVGTILGSVVIPVVNSRIDKHRRFAEPRAQRAATISTPVSFGAGKDAWAKHGTWTNCL
jgi:hypothetical protein